MDNHLKNGGITVASGHADYDPTSDKSAHSVLERADERMYIRKRQMKEQTDR